MVGWSAFEKALDKVGGHTNLVGKYWITTFNMFRRLLNAINLLFLKFYKINLKKKI